MQQLAAGLDWDDGFAFYNHGDVKEALQRAAKTIDAEYCAPYLAHAPLEPMNCTVQFKNGRATVWAPTQVAGLARRAAAIALDIGEDKVDVQVQYLGGGFGRRLDIDYIGQAAAIAKAVEGLPVQTMWSREEDMRHDFYRPACVSRFRAGFDAQGKLIAWRNSSASQAIVPQALGRYFGIPGIGPDKTRLEIWADPGIDRNSHRIEVDAEAARFSMTIENVPSENPRTGRIVALSVVALLRGLVSELKVGT